jgi:hypothetical protein
MLPSVSLYARGRGSAAVALLLLLLVGACEGPQDASPGLEPPSGRDGGDSFGNAGSPTTPSQGGKDGGAAIPGDVRPPASGAAGSASSAGSGAMMPPMVMPPPDMTGEPDDLDAGTEP